MIQPINSLSHSHTEKKKKNTVHKQIYAREFIDDYISVVYRLKCMK